jgi:hypothetical protein
VVLGPDDTFSVGSVITVYPGGPSLVDVVGGIGDASQSNPYLVRVATRIHDIGADTRRWATSAR